MPMGLGSQIGQGYLTIVDRPGWGLLGIRVISGHNDAWCQPRWDSPSLSGLRIEFVYQCGPYGLKLRSQLGVDLA